MKTSIILTTVVLSLFLSAQLWAQTEFGLLGSFNLTSLRSDLDRIVIGGETFNFDYPIKTGFGIGAT